MVEWFDSPPRFGKVSNHDVNRLLSYLMLSLGAPAHVRRIASRQNFPRLSVDFVRDVQVQAVDNVCRWYEKHPCDADTELFANEHHAAAAGNAYLQNAFLQVREGSHDPPESLGQSDDEQYPDDGDGDEEGLPELQAGDCGAIRLAITRLAADNLIACRHEDHSSDRCLHRPGTCPNPGTVLSVALQLVALRQGALPPFPAGARGVSPRDLKYAIVSIAAPDRVAARHGQVPGGARQVVRRCWHCALNLLARSTP